METVVVWMLLNFSSTTMIPIAQFATESECAHQVSVFTREYNLKMGANMMFVCQKMEVRK